ncbi:HU family DNA-binding protein [Marinilabilia rubra]|nr:DNA-binding domain-containing protein [Marinilabilia rubra]
MPLRYGLVENLLTDDPDDLMAVTVDNPTMGIDEIVERMISRGSTVTKAEALGTLEEFKSAVCDIVKDGNNVNTELFVIYPTVAGVFESKSEAFNASKHGINLNLRAGKRLIESSRDLNVERVEISESKPTLKTVTDLKTGAVNESVTVGQIVSIKGGLLKIDTESAEAGIFFIDPDGNAHKASRIVKNKPSELLFFVPDDLTPGTYQVEIRTVLYKRKSLSTGRLGQDIVVTG